MYNYIHERSASKCVYVQKRNAGKLKKSGTIPHKPIRLYVHMKSDSCLENEKQSVRMYLHNYSGIIICRIQAIVSMAPCLRVTDSLSPKYGKRSSTINCTDRETQVGRREETQGKS